MGETLNNRAGYICGYVDGNEVGEKGCRHLSKAAWGELEVNNLGLLNSDNNKIGDRGCQHISGGGWPRLKQVAMSIHRNISGDCGMREEGCRATAKR